MGLLEEIAERAKKAERHIILSEGKDARVQQAASTITERGIARITLMAEKDEVPADLRKKIEVVSPTANAQFETLASAYHALREKKGMTADQARIDMADPIVQAAMRVREGIADATVGGAITTTTHIVRTALRVLGTAPGTKTVSSFFLMVPPEGHALEGQPFLFGDCALIVEPTAEQLVDIGLASAKSCRALLGKDPRIAYLSFSTAGSAEHPVINPIREAVAIARGKEPNLEIDGEFQFDAAFDDSVRQRKAPETTLSGRPDIYVFPTLAAGNIGYKIAQRLGGIGAVGPILQGLSKPSNDLSRGCSADDIVSVAAITALQVE